MNSSDFAIDAQAAAKFGDFVTSPLGLLVVEADGGGGAGACGFSLESVRLRLFRISSRASLFLAAIRSPASDFVSKVLVALTSKMTSFCVSASEL